MTISLLGVAETLAKFAAIAAVGEVAGEAAKVAVSESVAASARSFVAVDTGETRDSVEVTEEGVEAGGAAPYLEFGTYKMAAQPFMRPAADEADESVAVQAATSSFGRL